MTRPAQIVGASLALLVLAAAGVWIGQGRSAGQERSSKPAASKAPPASPGVVTLDEKARSAAAITTAPLQPSSQREPVRAAAAVLPLRELADLHNQNAAQRIELEKARVRLDVSRKEYERLKRLFDDDQNVSAKAVEAANGTMRADDAAVRAAEQALLGMEQSARQAWGPVIAKWLVQSSAELSRLLRQEEVLVRITFTPSNGPVAPRAAVIQTPDGQAVPARYVSAAPEADARIQGVTYLYRSPARPGLVPGLSLTASVAGNRTLRGVLVPEAAVVWWQGKAWCYVETAGNRFERREVSTDVPVTRGWLQASGFTAGDKVVTSGAQLLLSQELRSQIQVAGEDES